MSRHSLLVGILCLVSAAAGCGDTPRAIFRDATLMNNELADLMSQVYDEDSAESQYKAKKDRFKDKWDNLKKRMRHFEQLAEDRDEKTEHDLIQGALDTLDEAADTSLRVALEVQRLKEIVRRADGKTTTLGTLCALPQTYDVALLWIHNPYLKPMRSMGFGGMPGGGMPGGGMPGGGPAGKMGQMMKDFMMKGRPGK